MAKIPRVKKPKEVRLQDCETHLYFLWSALEDYQRERERYKQVAAELRVLVARTKSNKPLLLDLMEEYGFAYEVPPPGLDPDGPPVKPGPIRLVGWRDDPVHQALQRDLAVAIETQNPAEMSQVEQRMAALAVPLPFRKWIDDGLAVFISPHEYSHRDLTLAIAQQSGSGHEDDSIDEPIARMQQFHIGGESSEVAVLIGFARSVANVGAQFLGHLVTQHGFRCRYFEEPSA